jgi:hypothetical protein
MRLTKTQTFIIDQIHTGGHIWYAGDFPYLAVIGDDGRVRSEPVRRSVADRLRELGLITRVEGENRWVTA